MNLPAPLPSRASPSYAGVESDWGGEPLHGWTVLLNPEGRVESVHAIGASPPLVGSTANWVGRRLSEVTAFPAPETLAQALTTLKTLSQPLQLPGRYPSGSHSIDMVWVLHPLLNPKGELFKVAAMGYWLNVHGLTEALYTPAPVLKGRGDEIEVHPYIQLQAYSPRLTQITRNVRWTLDLDIIQQQTVEGLGELFTADRCVVCGISPTQTNVIAAEYLGNKTLISWLGQPLPAADQLHLETAARQAGAVLVANHPHQSDQTTVAVATRYQGQVNGFILLYSPAVRPWTELELGLITDLADQVGTAIAHARVFSESHSLAIKLQQANASLLEKQRESQEARRQAEEARRQAEEASRLKSEFLANTSHELRTPLNGMIGFLKLVLDGMADDPAEQQEFIEEAHKSALHLLNLINDVLDLAKIEAGKMQIDMGPVNLRELLGDLESFARPQAEHKGLDF